MSYWPRQRPHLLPTPLCCPAPISYTGPSPLEGVTIDIGLAVIGRSSSARTRLEELEMFPFAQMNPTHHLGNPDPLDALPVIAALVCPLLVLLCALVWLFFYVRRYQRFMDR